MIRVIEVEEVENRAERMLGEIIEKFPDFTNISNPEIQETKQSPSRIKKIPPSQIIGKLLKTTHKKKEIFKKLLKEVVKSRQRHW